MSGSKTEFPPALPHSDLQEVFPDVFLVTGTFVATYGTETWQFSRNMTVVREGKNLTIINSIRLDEAGLSRLDALGTVKNVVKLGAAHGIDDAFYVNRYQPTLWALADATHEAGLETKALLKPDHVPFSDGSAFVFETSTKPEAVLLVRREGGILITCDSIKNWKTADQFFSKESGEKMAQYGMLEAASIDPNWARGCGIKPEEFQRLLTLPFRHLLPGHGTPIKDTAHEEVAATVKRVFPS